MDNKIQASNGGLTAEIIEQLKQPMDGARVKTRRAAGGGVVPYIEGADAINTANRIFNFDWSSEVRNIQFVQTEERSELKWNPETQKREATGERRLTGIYYATVAVSACGVSKMDVGRCICDGNAAEAHDMAIAGAVTDGLKRALRQFGDQFGNALYDKESDTFKEALQGQQPAWSRPAARSDAPNGSPAPREVRPNVQAPKPNPVRAAPQPTQDKPVAPAPVKPKAPIGRPVDSLVRPTRQASMIEDEN